DPDLGHWIYAYDTFDQLVAQTDARGQTTNMAYDKLGRRISRTEPDLSSTWTYDGATNGVGKLATASATGGAAPDNGDHRNYTYDSVGRPTQVASIIDQPTAYTLTYGYDSEPTSATYGKLLTTTYPNGLVTKNVYTSKGYLKQVINNATGAAYWTASDIDAE